MNLPYPQKDNEFIAWYPNAVRREAADKVWRPKDAAFYVHIPFCTAICDYCGFSVTRLKEGSAPAYLDALHREIQLYADRGKLANYEFSCGHFGGGTPSAIEGSELTAILNRVRRCFPVRSDAEITVEINPISFTREKALAYRDAGVNRLSFGLQSFNDRILSVIGRPHRQRDVGETLRIIEQTGWTNFSLDLIYGVPGQTMDDLTQDLDQVVAVGPAHVSCFRLEIIPFTQLKLREATGRIPPRLDTETLNAMDDLVSDRFTAAGFREYGAFNFARPGFESRHNDIAFMAPQGEYVGFGNSSYSFINGVIYCNYAELFEYCEAVGSGQFPIALARRVNALEAMSRYFALGLKFFTVPRQPFVDLFGMEPETAFGNILERLQGKGLIVVTENAYQLTRLGRQYVNNVCKEFFVGENRDARQYAQFVPTLTPEQILRIAKGPFNEHRSA